MKESKQKCPICNKLNVPLNSRYPKLVCSNCELKATDINGRKVSFFNDFSKPIDESNMVEYIGLGACYVDTNETYESNICYINNIKCQANEGRFGGIVIEVV